MLKGIERSDNGGGRPLIGHQPQRLYSRGRCPSGQMNNVGPSSGLQEDSGISIPFLKRSLGKSFPEGTDCHFLYSISFDLAGHRRHEGEHWSSPPLTSRCCIGVPSQSTRSLHLTRTKRREGKQRETLLSDAFLLPSSPRAHDVGHLLRKIFDGRNYMPRLMEYALCLCSI